MFETPAALFTLPSKKTATIEQFERDLDEFFYKNTQFFVFKNIY